jgi:hypothetical protein
VAGRAAQSGAAGLATAVSVGRIVGSRRDKEALWRRVGEPSPAVVDLESGAFARCWAGLTTVAGSPEADLPAADPPEWAILRAVSDALSDDLPLDFAAASDEGGHVVAARLARQLAMRPEALGPLRELRRRVARCAERLADAAIGWVEGGG